MIAMGVTPSPIFLLTAILVAVAFDLTAAAEDVHLEIASPAGTFRGSVLTSFSGYKYTAFRGIPFAAPPVGDLRFAKPHPHPVLEGVYDATKAAPVCLQPTGVDIGEPGQEDCLYLNVYSPLLHHTPKRAQWKVLVFIHGGAFFMGSGNEYVPGDLVTQGEIIVVTFNYRLSWLGFVKGNTTLLPGNQGLWDQLMALTWVKDNIAAFGGDPEDISISGNSMGGESVSVWALLQQGKDLFTKGLVMSGAMVACPSTPGSSDILLDLLLDRVGCWPPGMAQSDQRSSLAFSPSTMEQVVECLRDLPQEAFVLPAEGSLTNKFTAIDGDLFPRALPKMIQDPQYLKDVGFFSKDFIVSLVNHEGAPVSHGVFAAERGEQTEDDFLSKKMRIPVPLVRKVRQWYQDSQAATFNLRGEIWADVIMVVPPFQFLQGHTRALDKDQGSDSAKGKSYFLYFDHYPEFMSEPASSGMFHEMEMAYMFDLTPSFVLSSFYNLDTDEAFTQEDWKLKENFITMITDFMKYGDPGKSLKQPWFPYEDSNQFYLNFGTNSRVLQFPLGQRRHFWQEIFPVWQRQYMEAHSRDEL